MGGRKSLDTLANVILVCAVWNGRMESEAAIQKLAKEYGHKLEQWQDTSHPVYDVAVGAWFVLDEAGERHHYQEE